MPEQAEREHEAKRMARERVLSGVSGYLRSVDAFDPLEAAELRTVSQANGLSTDCVLRAASRQLRTRADWLVSQAGFLECQAAAVKARQSHGGRR